MMTMMAIAMPPITTHFLFDGVAGGGVIGGAAGAAAAGAAAGGPAGSTGAVVSGEPITGHFTSVVPGCGDCGS